MTSIDTILVCLFWTHSNNFQQNDVSMEVVKRGNITFPWIAEPYSETCQTLKMESYCLSGVLLLTLNRFYTRVLRVQFTLDIKHQINEFNVLKVSDKRLTSFWCLYRFIFNIFGTSLLISNFEQVRDCLQTTFLT